MKTEVTMQREFLGGQVAQRSKTGFFSATDLVRVANRQKIICNEPIFNFSEWLKTKSTLEFVTALEEKFDKVIIRSQGKGSSTWIHPLLFIDLALAISPKLKIEVYQWLFDHLIEFRNDSGDSYKLMCGTLYTNHGNQRTFSDHIKKLALVIQTHCGVKDWQLATEEQLKQRDQLHKDIAWLADVMNDNKQAIRLALTRSPPAPKIS